MFEVSFHVMLGIDHVVSELLELKIPPSVLFILLLILLLDASFEETFDVFVSVVPITPRHLVTIVGLFAVGLGQALAHIQVFVSIELSLLTHIVARVV